MGTVLAFLAFFKPFLGGSADFFKGLGSVLVKLASSRKAVLVAVASGLAVWVAVDPAAAAYQDVVYNKVDVFLGLLATLIALEDGLKGLKLSG